jgi:RNA polymerase sigma factor (TIGR02999 family)
MRGHTLIELMRQHCMSTNSEGQCERRPDAYLRARRDPPRYIPLTDLSEKARKEIQWREDFFSSAWSVVLPGEITVLLKEWAAGDQAALDRLIPTVYAELRDLARRYVRKERTGPSLRTATLVHEAYLRLVDIRNVDWQDRAHFFAISAQVMRRILIDAARARMSIKRRGEAKQEGASGVADVNCVQDPAGLRDHELIVVDEALDELGHLDPRKAKVTSCASLAG